MTHLRILWHISEHTTRYLKPTVYFIFTNRRANFHDPSQRFSQERSAFRLTLFRSKENDAATRATLSPVPPPLASPPFTSSSCIFPGMQSTAHWILKLLRGKGPVVRSVHLWCVSCPRFALDRVATPASARSFTQLGWIYSFTHSVQIQIFPPLHRNRIPDSAALELRSDPHCLPCLTTTDRHWATSPLLAVLYAEI
jgi:hypothetical protein